MRFLELLCLWLHWSICKVGHLVQPLHLLQGGLCRTDNGDLQAMPSLLQACLQLSLNMLLSLSDHVTCAGSHTAC